MKESIYMIVETDETELPLYAGTLRDVARIANVSENAVVSAISKAKKNKIKSKYVRVDVEDE